MRRLAILAAVAAALLLSGQLTAHADYAVMRSGARLHITAYVQTGDRMILTVDGGTVEVAASDVVAIEPEEVFPANPPTPTVEGPYANLIHSAASKHGVDEDLIQRVIAAESNFNPRAVSRKDAQGLMQLVPKTAARYSVVNVFDPGQNIDGGTRYLKDLLEQYRGNLPLALAAYNAGPETVARYGGVPPYRETQNYVHRITAELTRKWAQRSETKAEIRTAETAPVAQPIHNSRDDASALDRARQALFTVGVGAAGAAVPLAAPAPDHP